MIITPNMLNEIVPKDILPTRLDSALNLYTNINYKNKKGLILYNTNPTTWNSLYPFYELNHKFILNNFQIKDENITYGELIKEYEKFYQKDYEQKRGYNKEKRIHILKEEYIKTFNLNNANINAELTPVYELKFSKSQNVWTLYYFENYVANQIDDLEVLLNEELYEQKILPIDSKTTVIDGINIISNLSYILSIPSNIEILNNNIITN